MRTSHKPDSKSDDFIDPPHGPFEQLATDDVIMAKGSDSVGIGLGGVKSFHVIRDTFSGARVAYPMTSRDASSHAKNFRHFLGLKANEVATQVLVKMDEAGELEQAAHEAGLIPETSLPNRWPHNAVLERDIREEKECCRSIQMQSGLPYEYHVHAYPYMLVCPCRSTGPQFAITQRRNGKPSLGHHLLEQESVLASWCITVTSESPRERLSPTCLLVCFLVGELIQA